MRALGGSVVLGAVVLVVVMACPLCVGLAQRAPTPVAGEAGPVITLADVAALGDGFDAGTLVLLVLLTISEGLALLPSLKSNGILHAVILALRRATQRPPLPVVLLALAGLLTGCTALKGTMADGRFCTVWTSSDILDAVDAAVQTYPPGTDRQKVEAALVSAQAIGATGTAICELIRSTERPK